MNTLISLSDISFSRCGVPVLSRVSLQIRRGEHWRIRGGNGSGKTTLLKVLRGELNQDDGISPSRLWFFEGEESASPILGKKHVALVTPLAQDVYSQKGWNISGFECIATGIKDTPLLYEEITDKETERIEQIILFTNTDCLKDKSMLEMSRGETRKILIARALVSDPDVLLLDELLHELDPSSREEIVAVAEAAAARGITLVYTSHREDEILPCTKKTALLKDGLLTFDDSRAKSGQYEAQPPSRATLVLQTAHGYAHPHPVMSRNKEENPVLVSLINGTVSIDEKEILHNVDFEIRSGVHTAVTGRNGSGKSTLLRTVYGLHSPALEGSITRFDLDEHTPLSEAQRMMGFASAELQSSLYREDTLLDIILSGSGDDGYSEEQIKRAEELITRLRIGAQKERAFGDLSYGQQRKAVLARALAHRPKLLLLDEPMSGLDADSRESLTDILEEEAERGSTIVTAIHHAEDILPFARRIIALENGRIISSGE